MSDIAYGTNSFEDKLNHLMRPLIWGLRVLFYTLIFTAIFWLEGKTPLEFLLGHLVIGCAIGAALSAWGARRIWMIAQGRYA